jgi:hypothetical protein
MTSEEMAGFINRPSRWPLRPLLPLKRWNDDECETGYLMEGQGLIVFDAPQSAIGLYWDLDEFFGDGWTID